jgi:hypothetical protein
MATPFAFGRTSLVDSNGVPTRQGLLYFSSLSATLGQGSGSAVTITVSGGTATPDLSAGTIFVVVLTADTTLALPSNAPVAGSNPINWTLIVQQDNVGGHALLIAAYHMNYTLSTAQSPASTECVQTFSTDSSVTRVTAAPSIDQPIP